MSTSRIKSDQSSLVTITKGPKKGSPTFNEPSELDKYEVYLGVDNMLSKVCYYTVVFDCSFVMDDYPFDTQSCNMSLMPDLASVSFVELVPFLDVPIEKSNAAQYETPEVSISSVWDNQTGYNLVVQLVFKRNPFSIFMTTYIPTIIINIINTATNFWDGPEMFEAVVTVNLTCLMVLSALYISVSDSLPVNSSNIKMIDIWLLSNLLYPFLIVILHTYIHLLRSRKTCISYTKPMKKKNFHFLLLIRKCFDTDMQIKLGVFTSKFVLPVLAVSLATYYWISGLNK